MIEENKTARQLFAERQRTPITVQFFEGFLERETGEDLEEIFSRYVYGRSSLADGRETVAPEAVAPVPSKHPRRYTKAELARFR